MVLVRKTVGGTSTIKTIDLEKNIQISNPISNNYALTSKMDFQNVTVSVTDITGKEILKFENQNFYADQKVELGLPSSLKNGVYYFPLQSLGFNYFRKTD